MTTVTNNRWLTLFTLLLLTANIVTLALLWTHKGNGSNDRKPPPPLGEVFEYLTNELKLDSSQQHTYKQLREEHQGTQRPLQDSIGKAKDAFFALLQQSTTSDSLIQKYSKKIADLEQQKELFTFHHFQKLRAICNPEQQKKFDTIIQDVLKRMAPKRRQGPPPGREGDRPDRGRMPPPPDMENGDKDPPPHQ